MSEYVEKRSLDPSFDAGGLYGSTSATDRGLRYSKAEGSRSTGSRVCRTKVT